MATKTASKSTRVALAQQLIAGTSKHLLGTTPILLQGVSTTPSAIVERLQMLVSLRSDVDTAKAAVKAKVAREKAGTPALRALLSAYVTYVKAAFAEQPDALADFGITEKARTPLTAEAKTAAAAKRRATRAARHTMGTKQKAKVKGSVTGITVTPLTAPSPSAAVVTAPTAANAGPPLSPPAPAPLAGATAVTATATPPPVRAS